MMNQVASQTEIGKICSKQSPCSTPRLSRPAHTPSVALSHGQDPYLDSRFVDECQWPAKVKEPAPTRATERLPEPCRARTRPMERWPSLRVVEWLAPRDGVIWPGAGRGNNKELGKRGRRRPRLRTGTDMGHSAIDRRLDEVKAVLQRFQHFEQASVGPAPASKDATHPSRAPPRRAAIAPIFAAAAVMLTVLGTYTFFSCKQCATPPLASPRTGLYRVRQLRMKRCHRGRRPRCRPHRQRHGQWSRAPCSKWPVVESKPPARSWFALRPRPMSPGRLPAPMTRTFSAQY